MNSLQRLSGAQREAIAAVIRAEIERRKKGVLWVPFPDQPDRVHPQRLALESEADELFYGGAAGGGKTNLLIGTSITSHHTSIIFRRQLLQLDGIMQKAESILAGHGRFNQRWGRWRLNDGRLLVFGAMDKEDDWKKHQGKARDFMGFDEITHFTESQYRNVKGWNRPEDLAVGSTQRSRIICAGNPPTDAIGLWVIDYWGPWLDNKHPHPAREGELRWYATLSGKDVEVPDGAPIEHRDERTGKIEIIKPRSRTFIRSLVTDNPILMANDYMSVLQAMQEPMRSQMLYGDFQIGQNDADNQVIPSAWIQAAMDRWHDVDANLDPLPGQISPYDPETKRKLPMDALGVDVARGGKDNTVLAAVHDRWFARLKAYPGKTTPDGPAVLRLICAAIPPGSNPSVKVDVIGVGSSPYDFAKASLLDAHPMNGTAKSRERTKGGKLRYANMRAQWWWQLREALDPSLPEEERIALPPDRELLADLASATYVHGARGIQVEDKDVIKEKIGRSPDKGEAVVYAHGKPRRPLLEALPPVGGSPPIHIYQR